MCRGPRKNVLCAPKKYHKNDLDNIKHYYYKKVMQSHRKYTSSLFKIKDLDINNHH